MTTLTQPLYTLKRLKKDHAEELLAVTNRNRERLQEWFDWPKSVKTIIDAEAYIKKVNTLEERIQRVNYSLWLNDKMIGMAGLGHLDLKNQRADLFYWLDQDSEGQGIMTNACRHMINYGFKSLRLNRIAIFIASDNKKSLAIPTRLGFSEEGCLKKAERINNSFNDLKIFSLLREEWTPEQV